ncbi:MAG: hypothetical protein NTU57_02565 [Candidatus Aenigmarchaeota archaeon]|nr:hypothetical protein [Candidatus Aenigmarchaeota archaeon]
MKYVPHIPFDRKLVRKCSNVTGTDPKIIMKNVEAILEAIGGKKESDLLFTSWGVRSNKEMEAGKC